MKAAAEEVVREVGGLESGNSMVSLLNKSEIDQQIATAHKFPRNITKFRREALQMVTLNEQVAEQCIYALPRDGKTIEGPSARFAEVVASAWGNCRAGARVVEDRGDFVVAQGVFHDLERNVAITYEVQRRVTDKYGKRYKADMIGVTANAACSIALRNAVLKGVPKAFWDDMYMEARKVVMGDVKTLANRRADAVAAFQKFGISPDQICAKLGVAGVQDIGLEHLVVLRGLLTAIKDGDTTPEDAFGSTAPAQTARTAEPARSAELPEYPQAEFDKNLPTWRGLIEAGKKSADDLIAMLQTKARFTPEQLKAIRAPAPKAEAETAPATTEAEDYWPKDEEGQA
jgi:hypothetical protein